MVALCASTSHAQTRLPGPIPAELIRVIDGDTLKVRAHIWIGQSVEVSVRLAGIDAPELYRPKCPAERLQAETATRAVEYLASPDLTLEDVHLGKYAGRVIARVVTQDGADIADHLVRKGHAIPTGNARPWCMAFIPSGETASTATP